MGSGRAGLIRNALACLAVLVVLVAVGLGLPALNRRVPATHALPSGRPYVVAAGVTVTPPPGAQYDVTRTQTTRDGRQGAVLFVLGPARMTVLVLSYDGSLSQAATQVRAMITRAPGYQTLGPDGPVATSAGVAGRGGEYVAAGGSGRYAVFVAHGLAVQSTYATGGLSADVLPVLAASVASISFGAR
jgi:hypothetical protein